MKVFYALYTLKPRKFLAKHKDPIGFTGWPTGPTKPTGSTAHRAYKSYRVYRSHRAYRVTGPKGSGLGLTGSIKHISNQGALFSFRENNSISYSLYHPIVSLGDKPLDCILKNFKKLVLSDDAPLKRIYSSALNEAERQSLNISCYRLCRDFSEAESVPDPVVKLKVCSAKEIIKNLNPQSKKKYILDANGQLSLEDMMILEDCGLNRGLIVGWIVG